MCCLRPAESLAAQRNRARGAGMFAGLTFLVTGFKDEGEKARTVKDIQKHGGVVMQGLPPPPAASGALNGGRSRRWVMYLSVVNCTCTRVIMLISMPHHTTWHSSTSGHTAHDSS